MFRSTRDCKIYCYRNLQGRVPRPRATVWNSKTCINRFNELAVHAVRRVLGGRPGPIDEYPHTDKAGVLRHQAGSSGKIGTAEMYPAAAKIPFVRGFCQNGVSTARIRVRGARNGMKLSCRTAHSAGRPSQSSSMTEEGPASHNAAFDMKCHLSFLLANECRRKSNEFSPGRQGFPHGRQGISENCSNFGSQASLML